MAPVQLRCVSASANVTWEVGMLMQPSIVWHYSYPCLVLACYHVIKLRFRNLYGSRDYLISHHSAIACRQDSCMQHQTSHTSINLSIVIDSIRDTIYTLMETDIQLMQHKYIHTCIHTTYSVTQDSANPLSFSLAPRMASLQHPIWLLFQQFANNKKLPPRSTILIFSLLSLSPSQSPASCRLVFHMPAVAGEWMLNIVIIAVDGICRCENISLYFLPQ